MKARLLSTVLIALLALSGCFTPKGYYDLVTLVQPVVTSEVKSADAGEFLEVIVTTGVGLAARSRRAEEEYWYRVGICLVPQAAPVPLDTCYRDVPVVPEGLELAEGDSLSHDGEVTVLRGQTVTLTHRIRFTSSVPVDVTAIGLHYSLGSSGGIGGEIYSLEEQRVTLTFEYGVFALLNRAGFGRGSALTRPASASRTATSVSNAGYPRGTRLCARFGRRGARQPSRAVIGAIA